MFKASSLEISLSFCCRSRLMARMQIAPPRALPGRCLTQPCRFCRQCELGASIRRGDKLPACAEGPQAGSSRLRNRDRLSRKLRAPRHGDCYEP